MILDDHDVPYGEVFVQAARGIGQNEALEAQTLHDPDGKGGLRGGVAFVQMETPLHDQHGDAARISQEQVAGVAQGRADGKMRYGAVRQADGTVYEIGQGSQAAAQDQARLRRTWAARAQELRRLVVSRRRGMRRLELPEVHASFVSAAASVRAAPRAPRLRFGCACAAWLWRIISRVTAR